MAVRSGSGPVPMAVSLSRPAVSRPTVSARVAGAMATRNRPRGHSGFCVSGGSLGVLVVPVPAISRAAVPAGEGTEQGQALIVGVRRLNFFAAVDAARSGFRLSGDRDQRS